MFHHLVNTSQFSYTARDFARNGNKYTRAPQGSRDYFEFWEEEDRRCRYGMTSGDLWIPGRMYFWLNHFPINRVPEKERLRLLKLRRETGKLVKAAVEKEIGFPGFHEVHYEWWNFKHIAWYGGEFSGVESEGNKHLACLKSRGAGWSYLEACDGVYNYNFIPGSKSYYFAGTLPYLVGDAIMDKVQSGLDWINKYSPYWRQNRQVHKNVMHQRASYLDAAGVETGSMSEIIAQVVDKPSKTRGKRGRKISFEEGGSFPKLEASLEVALGSLREGSMYVGQASIFGTGGEEGPGIQGLDNIFNNPIVWDMLAFPNVWESGMQHSPCGYFVPCWRVNSWFMDEEGNVEAREAIAEDDKERDKKKLGKPKDLDLRKAEYPRTPTEALLRTNGNGYNIAEIDAQLKRLKDPAVQSLIRYGKIITDPDHGELFQPLSREAANPILDYPHRQGEGITLEGAFAMIQKPYKVNGKVPDKMYLITFDPYAKEDAADKTSLWSFKVWKLENQWDNSYSNLPVAWWAGRPKRYEDCHDLMFKVARMFNAEIQGEIAGGGQSVVTYARTRRILHMLRHSPESVSNKENQAKSVQNAYLMDMPTDRKNLGITYSEDWHVAPRAVSDKGNIILNIHNIYDKPFLEEMKKFNPLAGNYDRISDMLIFMFEQKQHYVEMVQTRKETSAFWKRSLYGEEVFEEGEVTTAY